MAEVIDTNRNVTAIIPCLKEHGVRGVVRYYNRNATPKVIRKPEVDAILAAGLDLCIVHQRGGLDASEFDAGTGRLDAEHCRDYGAAMAQPSGSGMYFAVDFDIGAQDLARHVVPYFEAIAQTMAVADARPRFRIGVYGSGLTCRTLLDAGLVELTWLSQSRGFRGSPEFRASNRWSMLQLLSETLCGIGVDPDIVQPGKPDYGQFNVAGPVGVVPAAPPTPRPRMRVVARTGLRLRSGPGVEFEQLALMPFGQVVTAMRIEGPWTLVDIEGDARIDGAALSAFMEAVV